MHIQRRQLLALASCAGITLLTNGIASAGEQPRFGVSSLDALRGNRKCLIHIMLKGGNDGLNTVIPLADPLYTQLRPTLAISSSAALPLDNGLALNPALRPLTSLWDRGQCQVHLGVTSPASASHVGATTAWHAHDLRQERNVGWIASLAETHSSTPSPLYGLVFGDDEAPVSGGRMIPITMDTASDHGFTTTTEDSATARHQREMAGLIRQAAAQGPSLGFTGSSLAQRLCQTAALLAAGLTPSAVLITHDGYDTHVDQRKTHDELLADLASSLSTFAQAMRTSGRWDDIVIVTGSEFGRQAAENATGGTDHGAHNCQLVLGGTVKGGFVGRQPSLSALSDDKVIENSSLLSLRKSVAQVYSRRSLFAV